MSSLTVRALAPELSDDALDFLATAFPDNPRWATCFCCHYHVRESEDPWAERTGEMNRSMKADLIQQGKAFGVLAYRDGQVVGWCHAAPQLTLKRLEEYREEPGFRGADAADVGSIVCLVVAPGERGRGVGSKLVAAATDLLRDLGMTWAEAYPLSQPPIATASLSREARSYHGSLAMFERAGFERQYEIDDMLVVRLRLSPG
ncbi:MAG: hypothetical protein QOK05_114 [Chloroflexota bacterium]|nr:hypothetical protein [Chloroflexota bacterium]